MGWKYEVEAWEKCSDGEYRYVTKWGGSYLLLALWNLIKVKRQGYGCVTLSWR